MYVDADCNAEQSVRKLSTVSLSHIEGELNNAARNATLRANLSSQSLGIMESTRNEDPDLTGDGVLSPPTAVPTASRTGKFFVFGGTRSARKTASKQKQQV